MKTKNGYPILRSHATDAVGGMRAGWMVLCDISKTNQDDPFAVWWMDEDGNTFLGNYCETRDEADEAFNRRVQREVRAGRTTA